MVAEVQREEEIEQNEVGGYGALDDAELEAELEAELKPTRPSAGQKVMDFIYAKTPQRFKNASDLQIRIRTGAVYSIVTLLGLLTGNIPCVVMLSLTAALAAGEFFYMLRTDDKLHNEIIGIIGAMLFPPAMYLGGLAYAMVVALMLMVALIVWYVCNLRARIADICVSFFGAAYTGLFLSSIMLLRPALPEPWGGVLVLFIFISVWLNDGCAYLVGCRFGKHHMAPKISPKKTWEGFAAGMVGGTAFWCAMLLIPGLNITVWQCLLFGAICGVLGVFGDLAESRIKRNSGVKDSGTMLPGHGGILDRTDSLFLAVVAAAFLLEVGGCLPAGV